MTKRILALVLSFIMLLSTGMVDARLTVSATGTETGQELIVNGGFENVTDNFPDHWDIKDGAKGVNYVSDTTEKNSGNTSLKIVPDASLAEPYITQTVSVTENTAYKLSLSAKASKGIEYTIGYYGESGYISEVKDKVWPTAGEWKSLGPVDFTTPENCNKVIIKLKVKETMYIDDVSLIGPAPATEPECEHTGETEVRDAIEATTFTPGYTGDTYCLECNSETAIKTGETIPATGVEFVANGGFENVTDNFPDNWDIKDGAKGVNYVSDTTEKNSGNTSLKIVPDASLAEPYITQTVSVTENTAYKLSLSAKASKGIEYTIGYYGDNGYISEVKDKVWPTAGEWKSLGPVDFTTPENCNKVIIKLKVKETMYLDDVSLIGPAPATEPSEPSEPSEPGCSHSSGTYYKADTAIEATETTAGYKGDIYCVDCEVKIRDGESIPTIDKESLTNGGFEEPNEAGTFPSEWKNSNGAMGTDYVYVTKTNTETDTVYGGEDSVKILPNTNERIIQQTGITVEANKTYQFSAWVRIDEAVEGKSLENQVRVGPEIECKDVNGNKIGNTLDGKWTYPYASSSGAQLGQWTQITYEFKTPADCATVNLKIYTKHCKEVYIDDVSIKHAHTGGTATCTTQAVCTECGQAYGEFGHTGGTATCTEQAVCETCKLAYGEVDSSNHIGGTATCTEQAICTRCSQPYGEVGHTGGTATCKELAICEKCEEPYGEKNAQNHSDYGTRTENAREATETRPGYSGDKYCEGCDQLIEKGSVIPQTGEIIIQELLKNASLESFTGNKPDDWKIPSAIEERDYLKEETIKHDGGSTASVKLVGERMAELKSLWLQQTVNILGGTEYTLSGWVYPTEEVKSTDITIKIEYYTTNENDEVVYANQKVEPGIGTLAENGKLTPNQWNKIEYTFTPDIDMVQVAVLFRLNKDTVIYFDDLSLMGQKPPVPDPRWSKIYVPMPEGSQELVKNPSFEVLEDGAPKYWEVVSTAWKDNQWVSISDVNPYDGNTVVRIDDQTKKMAWVRQPIKGDFRKGEVYQMSAWVRKEDSGRFGMKLEWYNGDEYLGGNNSDFFTEVTGEQWVQVVQHYTVAEDCDTIYFYNRMFNIGATDIDSVSFYKISDPEKVSVETDEIFYYTQEADEGGYGTAEAFVYSSYYQELAGKTVTFRLKYGDDVLAESKGHEVIDEYATWKFPLSLMKNVSLTDGDTLEEKWKGYTLEAAAVDANGNETALGSEVIYICPRPTTINDNGKIVEPDGSIFTPITYYHVERTEEEYNKVKAIGGTVVQANSERVAGIQECLDLAEKVGLKVLVPLYNNMNPAGHESNVENTTEVINAIKDHPALLAYAVMDEPSSYWGQKLYVFEDSYKLIRGLDPAHPVYMVEASADWFETFNKYVDVLGIDPYLQADKDGNRKYQVEHVREYAELATAATNYQKPVWCINQLEKLGNYQPDENGIRNMFYQGLMGGADTIGYFPFYGCYKDENGNRVDLDDTTRYDILKNFYASDEVTEAYNHFVDRMYPIFAEKMEDAYWVSSYVKDDVLYMITVNNTVNPTECNIPLISDSGAVIIGDFSAEMIYGHTEYTETAKTVTGNGTLSFHLEYDGAYVWKITPSDTVDFSVIEGSKCEDIYNTPWAQEAIRELEANGILDNMVGKNFAPQKLITRAEFAYMLVGALGDKLEDKKEEVADVHSNAYYREALEICNGNELLPVDDDGNYEPEVEISRQDMMAIIAQYLNLGGDISGTPQTAKKSTTRAEAAVIINKLMKLNEK